MGDPARTQNPAFIFLVAVENIDFVVGRTRRQACAIIICHQTLNAGSFTICNVLDKVVVAARDGELGNAGVVVPFQGRHENDDGGRREIRNIAVAFKIGQQELSGKAKEICLRTRTERPKMWSGSGRIARLTSKSQGNDSTIPRSLQNLKSARSLA